MLLRGVVIAIVPTLGLLSALWAAGPIPDWRQFPNDASAVGKRTSRQQQNPSKFREYPAWEYNDYPIPPDSSIPGEWIFARFMYRAVPGQSIALDQPGVFRRLCAGGRVSKPDPLRSQWPRKMETTSTTGRGFTRW